MKYYRKKQYTPINEVTFPNNKNGNIRYEYFGKGHEGFTCDCVIKTPMCWKPEPYQTLCVQCAKYASSLMCRLIDKEEYL